MSGVTEYNFYKNLLENGECRVKSVPKIVAQSSNYKFFNDGLPNGTLVIEKRGRGSIVKVNPEKKIRLEKFFNSRFPNHISAIKNRVNSIATFRDSKTQKGKSEPIYFLRGDKTIQINNKQLNLNEYTNSYGLFAVKAPLLKVDKLCFVENKDVFLQAEKIIPSDYIFIHKYGRVGIKDLKKFEANKVLVFSDYDFTGLNEYLNIKSVFKNCVFFVPNNYEVLFNKYSKKLPKNKNLSQKISASKDEVVVRIKEQIQKTNQFLEQESLFIK